VVFVPHTELAVEFIKRATHDVFVTVDGCRRSLNQTFSSERNRLWLHNAADCCAAVMLRIPVGNSDNTVRLELYGG